MKILKSNKTALLVLLSILIPINAYADISGCLAPLPNTKNIETTIDNLKTEQSDKIFKSVLNAFNDTANGNSSVGGALLDFLSDVELAGLVVNDGDAENGEPLTLTHNLKLFGDIEQNRHNHDSMIQLRIFRSSQVSSDLAELLSEEATSSLQSQLDEFDDYEVSYSYSWKNSSTGRTINRYQPILDQLITSRVKQLTDERNKTREKLVDKLISANEKCTNEFFEPSAATTKELENAYKAASKAQSILSNAYIDFTSSYQPAKYGALLSNQPQLIFSASYRDRNELVGADEFGIKVSYEFGLFNLNGLKKHHQKAILHNKDADKKSEPVSFYQSYAKYINKFNPILRDDRFSFSLDYSDVDDFSFENSNVNFFKEGGEKIEATLSYGRTLSIRNDKAFLRLDAGVQAIEFLGDTEGVDRLVASATLTYRIDDRVSIPITLEYANRSEFLSDESNSFGANIGFKYDFNFEGN